MKCRFFSVLFQATFSVLGEKVTLKTYDEKLVRMRPCQEWFICCLSEFRNFLYQCPSIHPAVHPIVHPSVSLVVLQSIPPSNSIGTPIYCLFTLCRFFLGESLVFAESCTCTSCHCWKWSKLQCQWADLALISRCYFMNIKIYWFDWMQVWMWLGIHSNDNLWLIC